MADQKDGVDSNKNTVEVSKELIDEAVLIMRNNMEVLWERESKLNDLGFRAETLQSDADDFQRYSSMMRRKYRWQNFKLAMVLVIFGFLLSFLIVTLIMWSIFK